MVLPGPDEKAISEMQHCSNYNHLASTQHPAQMDILGGEGSSVAVMGAGAERFKRRSTRK